LSEFLASIEGSALAVWTRESTSIWAYPTFLTLHTVGLAIVAGVSAVVDVRLLGMARRIPIAALRPLFRIMWWAFALNFLTGVVLFMADATAKSTQTVFWIKIALIVLALVVTLQVSRSVRADDPPTTRTRVLATVSLVLWAGAIVAGRLLAYV
jgi:hypothetical protein